MFISCVGGKLAGFRPCRLNHGVYTPSELFPMLYSCTRDLMACSLNKSDAIAATRNINTNTVNEIRPKYKDVYRIVLCSKMTIKQFNHRR